ADGESGGAEALREEVAFSLEGGCGILEECVWKAESDGDRRLKRCAVNEGEKLLDRENRLDEAGGRRDPAHFPAGRVERLAAARDGDGALPAAGQARDRSVACSVEHKVLVDLVGDD